MIATGPPSVRCSRDIRRRVLCVPLNGSPDFKRSPRAVDVFSDSDIQLNLECVSIANVVCLICSVRLSGVCNNDFGRTRKIVDKKKELIIESFFRPRWRRIHGSGVVITSAYNFI